MMQYAHYDGDLLSFINILLSKITCPHQALKEFERLSDERPCIIDEQNQRALVFSSSIAHAVFSSSNFSRSLRLSLLSDNIDLETKYDVYRHYSAMPVFVESKDYPDIIEKKFFARGAELNNSLKLFAVRLASECVHCSDDITKLITKSMAECAKEFFSQAIVLDAEVIAQHSDAYMKVLGQTVYDNDTYQAQKAIEYFRSVANRLLDSEQWFKGSNLTADILSPFIAQWIAGFLVPTHTYLANALLIEWLRQGGISTTEGAHYTATDELPLSDAKIPFQFANRDCLEDTIIENYHFKKGMRVHVFLGIANWDDARQLKPRLEFGPINRPCLGMGISRSMKRHFIEELRRIRLPVNQSSLSYRLNDARPLLRYETMNYVKL